MSVLFDECLQALGGGAKIISADDAEAVFSDIEKKFLFSVSGSLKNCDGYSSVRGDVSDLLAKFDNKSGILYIFWDDASVPVLEIPASHIPIVKSCIGDILAVGLKTFIYKPSIISIIEASSYEVGLFLSRDSLG
ncbi:CDI toxin immunity protein [Chromobacterium paludis]|uniref:Uncharacterized protein n=1 Tax=Chromobacterium paludis TaxID=2605945 RepID=A0A5C1DGU0_9NEIS|nr:hypothetical protein [Chromobacterium paludis]QEL55179.1 hypothetical protein FYK34_06165 [Chromobacterium paludis]